MTTAARGIFLALITALMPPLVKDLPERHFFPIPTSGHIVSEKDTPQPLPAWRTTAQAAFIGAWRTAQSTDRGKEKEGERRSSTTGTGKRPDGPTEADQVWRSDDLDILGIGIGVGDVGGRGKNEIVIISPNTVYLYRMIHGKMELLTEYSAGSLELKSVDVAKIRKQGPARIYVSAQNRGSVASFVLEYRNGKLEPVIQDVRFFLRVIRYPTLGPVLLGQNKGLNRMYEGPIFRVNDTGTDLEAGDRFGVPLKIPIFGFAIGDLEGKRSPLIAVYDKEEHLRVYTPGGKRLYVSQDYFAGSDIILRWGGPENRRDGENIVDEVERVYFRPRIMCEPTAPGSPEQILVISHSSKTGRFLSRTKMLEDGRVVGYLWNGDAVTEKWKTPSIQGMVTDFTVDTLPDIEGKRLIVLERKKTDWLSFIKSKSQVKAYSLQSLMTTAPGE